MIRVTVGIMVTYSGTVDGTLDFIRNKRVVQFLTSQSGAGLHQPRRHDSARTLESRDYSSLDYKPT